MSLDGDNFFCQNTGQTLENDIFLEEETFKLVAPGKNEEKDKISIFSPTFWNFCLTKSFSFLHLPYLSIDSFPLLLFLKGCCVFVS